MPETLEWAVVITARVKDRGQVTFPPKEIDPDSDEKVAAAVSTAAARARKIFGTHDSKAVNLTVKFVERTVVTS